MQPANSHWGINSRLPDEPPLGFSIDAVPDMTKVDSDATRWFSLRRTGINSEGVSRSRGSALNEPPIVEADPFRTEEPVQCEL
jgi:hypothetical protein